MKKKIWIPVVLTAFLLIGLLTAYNSTKSNGNETDRESALTLINKCGSSLAGKPFYTPLDAPPQKNASYKNNAVKNNAVDRNSTQTETFVVSGIGRTVKEARKDALNNAYKRYCVNFKSDKVHKYKNGFKEIEEEYVEISDVIVENTEVLSAQLIDGVVHVQLRVTVTNIATSH